MDYINNLDWKDGIRLINKAVEKTIEQRQWEAYLTLYPNMDKKTYVPFEKWKSKTIKESKKECKKMLNNDEILKKAEELRLVHQGKHKGIVKSSKTQF